MKAEVPPNLSPPAEGETESDASSYTSAFDPEKLLDRIKSRYTEGVSAMEENRRLHSEDLNFIYNAEAQAQWDPVVLEARKGKPCYTFNRVLGPVNIVNADMRQTRPSVKYRPSRGGATQPIADIYGGLFRSMEKDSHAVQIYKEQYKYAVGGGYGAWRLVPEFADDDTFDQVLRLKSIANPQNVVWDPQCDEPCAGDAMWCEVATRISRDQHIALFPDCDLTSFNWSRDSYGWFTDKDIRVVDYYERVPFEKTIALLSSGDVIDWVADEEKAIAHLDSLGMKHAKVVKTRTVLKWRVLWCRANGAQILDEPEYYDWKRIPVIRVPGRYINIEGRKKFQSLIRHSKDAQRSYNSRNSDMIERSALTPKAPYLVTEAMIKGYEQVWAQANTASRPYLPYNIDPKAVQSGGMPERTPPIDVPTAALALSQQALADIQATTGYFDPALGNAEDMNRVSGKALVQHTRRSDLGSFEFIDGFGDAMQLTAEMFADMVPTVMDTERVERIIGMDDVEKMITLNGEDDDGNVINDLREGSYDCTVTIGPSFQTARQESLDTLISIAETIPQAQNLIGDLILKNIDSPDADEMARRLRIPLIQAGIVQPTASEKAQLPPPPQPSPEQQMQSTLMQARTGKAVADAHLASQKLKNSPLEVHRLIYEAAGKHLANILAAQNIKSNTAEYAADQAERAAAAGDQTGSAGSGETS
jgi:hypothetical protein